MPSGLSSSEYLPLELDGLALMDWLGAYSLVMPIGRLALDDLTIPSKSEEQGHVPSADPCKAFNLDSRSPMDQNNRLRASAKGIGSQE